MNLFKTIRFGLLLILFIVFITLTFVSFKMVISGEENGHGGTSPLGEGAFNFFRFPIHSLFNVKAGDSLYFWGFLINSAFYAFIVERILYLFKRKDVKRSTSRG